MEDERRHVDLLQVLGEIRFGKRLDAEVGRGKPRHHSLQPERLTHAFGDLRARPVVAVERQAEILPELRAISEHIRRGLPSNASIGSPPGLAVVFNINGGTAPISYGFGDALRAVPADVAGHFAAARGVAHVNGVLQIERLDQRRKVVGVGVHVVAVPRLARPAMAATVMGDATVAARGQEEHLVLECVRGERPAVAED